MTDTISRKIVSANIFCTILIVCLHARYEYNGVYNIIGTLSDIAVPVFLLYHLTFISRNLIGIIQ